MSLCSVCFGQRVAMTYSHVCRSRSPVLSRALTTIPIPGHKARPPGTIDLPASCLIYHAGGLSPLEVRRCVKTILDLEVENEVARLTRDQPFWKKRMPQDVADRIRA